VATSCPVITVSSVRILAAKPVLTAVSATRAQMGTGDQRVTSRVVLDAQDLCVT